ncbi:MAG: pyridoxal-phosphate dependent enzyme [Alphaproteobacteria bacterium]|nr:pyridoxal-phosphate dependent enzyme [Alphaproteobacteria bacterium]
MKNVFKGKEGIASFLNPENHITPLVELNEKLNPFLKDKIHIFIKMQTFLPLMNVKSASAYGMISKSPKKDKVKLVESSSGNMAFSLSILSSFFGFEKMRAIISSEASIGKMQMLLLSGAEVLVNEEPVCPNPHDTTSGINLAKKMGKRDWMNLNQYANPNNPAAHYEMTGTQIYTQLEGNIQVFCSSLGTTGSMNGISKKLKEKDDKIMCVGVVRKPNNPVPGPRTLGLLKMIDFDWEAACDDIVACSSKQAYQKSMELCRQGLLAGPSSGLNLYGLLTYLKRMKVSEKLEALRNEKGEINCVFLGCDLPFLYLDEYFKTLPRKMFPRILHEEKLRTPLQFAPQKKTKVSLTARRMLKEVFGKTALQLWKKVEQKEALLINKETLLIDTRSPNQFHCGRIPNSINLEERDILSNEKEYLSKWEAKKVIFICQYGELSFHLAKMFSAQGIKAFSLEEGFAKWSELDFPRLSEHCKIERQTKGNPLKSL